MKTTIYELLGMIKDNKAPKKIIYRENLWEYDIQDKDYWANSYDGTEWLFDDYIISNILNDEVEILETTIKPDLGTIIGYKKGETDNAGYIGVVDKINEDGSVCLKQDKIEKIDITDKSICVKGTRFFRDKDIEIFQKLSMVINEIIDKLNKDQV